MLEAEQLTIKTELDRILSSKVFKRSNVLSNFLRYVVIETIEEKADEIKEYSIAVKALGKPSDFNPQLDAMIRIHAGRLRRSLLEYYSNEGVNDPMIISLKKGGYIPEFNEISRSAEVVAKETVDGLNAGKNLPFNRVAVLPFKNLSGLAENDFMVDGFGEQLGSDLAQFREITVIAYYSTAKFKDAKPDIRTVGRELNTSHLITGSIYRDKKHLRISMQLVNAVTGAQLWAQTYNRAIGSGYLYDIFDDIIKQVVPRLTGYYGLINRNSDFSTQLDPSADQHTVDAVFWYYHYQVIHTEDIYQTARRRIEKALQHNPNYALAWAILAQLYVDGMAYFYENVADPLEEANKCVQRALQLDPNCQHAYLSLTWMFIFLRDKRNAIEAMERGMAINPRSAFYLGASSFLFSLLGEYDKGMECFKQSDILNPFYPWWVNLGPVFTYFYNCDYEKALEYANRIHIPGVFWNDIFKIASLAQLLRTREATDLAEKYRVQFPGKAEGACSIIKVIIYHGVVYDRIKEGLVKQGCWFNNSFSVLRILLTIS